MTHSDFGCSALISSMLIDTVGTVVEQLGLNMSILLIDELSTIGREIIKLHNLLGKKYKGNPCKHLDMWRFVKAHCLDLAKIPCLTAAPSRYMKLVLHRIFIFSLAHSELCISCKTNAICKLAGIV